MLFFKKKSSRAMKQTSSESTATAETVPRCRSSPTPQESEQQGTKTAATLTANEQIARDWVLAMQNHDRSRLHDITDLGGVFLMRDAVAGELEYRIDDLYDIFSNFCASVPDCDYECGRIYESSPNEVVLEGLCWFGHHTGKAFPFEPNPAIPMIDLLARFQKALRKSGTCRRENAFNRLLQRPRQEQRVPSTGYVPRSFREIHTLQSVVYIEENAHDGAVWSLDLRRRSPADDEVVVVTGSADHSVKFWVIEVQEEEDGEYVGQPMFVQTRVLKMTDDVVAVKFSKLPDSSKRMVFVSTLDSTVKVFFEDSLKMFLSLYGHKLPALAVDCSDDDVLLASAGADKTVKIWGLDFGDTHRTLHGHDDSITDVQFLNRTHNFFTASKDGTVRYWDGDRFEQILLLNGHFAEVNSLTLSRTGAFFLSGGMDRNIRVWERTRDIVFLDEERENAGKTVPNFVLLRCSQRSSAIVLECQD